MRLKTRLCSSLAKIFPQEEPQGVPYHSASALKGERFSFQFVFHTKKQWTPFRVEVDSALRKYVRVRKVELVPVPSLSPFLPEEWAEEDLISHQPGLYPDLLEELPDPYYPLPDAWNALWITVELPETIQGDRYPIRLRLLESGADAGEQVLILDVIDLVLPPQKLICTSWVHADCLAVYYDTPMWSGKHWSILEKFIRSAVRHGINMLYTPLLTPPLDTAPGEVRPTTQLIGIRKKKGDYFFDFSRLDRWINMAQNSGMNYFEFSHLFSQWGARYAPKVVADVNGSEQRIFGWETSGTDPEYRKFLAQLLPQLTDFLIRKNLRKQCYFHCSDEPNRKQMESYREAFLFLHKFLKEFHLFDAMSDTGVARRIPEVIPIPAEEHIKTFALQRPEQLWTYYSCTSQKKVSNRFLHMPSSRNRILGALLYRYGISGFLNWGFNFYYSGLSRFPLDPFRRTDAGGAFPPGDAFLVYPGRNGAPLDSIHYEVFAEALQDFRVLSLLERYLHRDKIMDMLDHHSPGGRMTMTEYPRGENAVLSLRKRINKCLAGYGKKIP